MVNKVCILGTIVSKPELSFDKSLSQTYLLIATTNEDTMNDEDIAKDEKMSSSTLVDVLVRGKHAETCFKELDVFSKVLVEGRLYFCKKDGVVRVLAERVQLLEKTSNEEKK